MQEQELSFGSYRLQLLNEQLWRGKRAIRLTPKAFAVLRYLSEHPGQLVTKDALFEAVWHETVVSDVTLAGCVGEVRKALSDDAKTPRFIETVHRRGYRFVAPVYGPEEGEVADQADPVPAAAQLNGDLPVHEAERPVPERLRDLGQLDLPPSRATHRSPWLRPTWIVAIVVLIVGGIAASWGVFSPPEEPVLPLPDKPSIAVLPFSNMSGDPSQEYFSDGMTDAIIADLSKFSGLLVIARQSTFTYKGPAVDIKTVGRELGVRYVLEGSVQRSADQVRIMVQLIDAITGLHVWAESYDGELQDIFAVQDAITQQVGAALRVQVVEAEQARVRRIPTHNLSAYDAWLLGQEQYERYTKEGNVRAQQLFERAIALDPQYADAYAFLGWTYWLEWIWRTPDPLLLDQAGELARQALTLDDSLPLAHWLVSTVYLYQKQPEQALTAAQRAIALDPNGVDAYIALVEVLNTIGRAEEAIGMMQQAKRLNPHYPADYAFYLGWSHRLTGQYAQAITALQDSLRRNSNFIPAHLHLARTYLDQWSGQWEQDPQLLERAVAAAQYAVALSDSMFWAHGVLSCVHLWQKNYEEARAEAERALELNPHDALSHAYVGNVQNFAGQQEESLARMEQVTCATAFGTTPAFCSSVLGNAYYLTERYEEAIAAFTQALSAKPSVADRLEAQLGLAASYSELGQLEDAKAVIAEMWQVSPHFSLAGVRQRWPFQEPQDLERFVSALRKAGLE